MSDHILMCTAREDVTADMATFSFTSPDGPLFDFRPGQFLSITLTIDGRDVQRCYSISSSPVRRDALSITVKRVAGGHVSNWLHDHLRPGMSIIAAGPSGRFSYVTAHADKYLFISAGSGITPVMSMVRAATDTDLTADIVFVHSARTTADIPFRAELDDLAARHPGLTVAYARTRTDATDAGPGHRGRVDGNLLALICPDMTEREIFLCGPGGFRSSVRTALVTAGVPLTRIHEESFGFAAPTTDHIVTAESGHTVDFTRRARRVTVSPGTTILSAAASAGVTLPSSCGVGLCGSCKVRKVSGDVVMNHQGGIRPREIEQGKILLCCSEPLTPVVIDY